MLHNFGGRTGLYGALQSVASLPAVAYRQAPNMVGMGLTPEAIETNVIVYDLMMEMPWRVYLNRSGILGDQLNQWVLNFTVRRYGGYSSHAADAWALLAHTVYNCTVPMQGTVHSLIATRPITSIGNGNKLYYDPRVVIEALTYLVNASTIHAFAQQETLQHDIASVTRQMLSNGFLVFFSNMMGAFEANNTSAFDKWSQILLNTILDTDTIVLTQKMWLVGKWIADARAWGTTPAEVAQYEFNARNQLTLWGPQTSVLRDYAYKLWAGLVRDFYYMRWRLFVAELGDALANRTPFDYAVFEAKVEVAEYAWCLENKTYTATPLGDAVGLAAQMLAKYKPLVEEGTMVMSMGV